MHVWVVVFMALILVGLLALARSFSTWRHLRKIRKSAEAEAPWIEWAMAVTGAKTDEEILSQRTIFANDHYGRVSNTAFYNRAQTIFKAAQKRERSRNAATKHKDADAIELPFAILDVRKDDLDSEIALGIHQSDLANAFVSLMQQVLETAAREKSEKYLRCYMQVMDSNQLHGFCADYEIPFLTFPEDWDDLITQIVASPSVSDFRNVGEKTEAEVVLMAVEATMHGDMKVAKLVLAYCSSSDYEYRLYRGIIGDILFTELSRLVYSYENTRTYVPATDKVH